MLVLKKGTQVKVISGKDKGKSGEILEINRSSNRVKIKTINMIKKHLKPTKENKKILAGLKKGFRVAKDFTATPLPAIIELLTKRIIGLEKTINLPIRGSMAAKNFLIIRLIFFR